MPCYPLLYVLLLSGKGRIPVASLKHQGAGAKLGPPSCTSGSALAPSSAICCAFLHPAHSALHAPHLPKKIFPTNCCPWARAAFSPKNIWMELFCMFSLKVWVCWASRLRIRQSNHMLCYLYTGMDQVHCLVYPLSKCRFPSLLLVCGFVLWLAERE